MANTKAPSGIAITRSKEKLVIKWKQKDDYASQQMQYKLHTGSTKDAWKSISVGAGTTAKSLTIDRDKYHPNKNKGLNGITFRIRGKASNKGWSAWTSKGYDILVPNKPSVSVAQDSTLPNKVTFSWALSKSDTDRKIYTKVQYQSALATGNANPNWSKESYTLSTQDKTSGTVDYTEDTSVIADGSHTRYFRIRAVGPQGASAWVEKKFVYALPFQANNVVATVAETEEGGLNAVVTWTTKIDKAHPVAKTTVQYAMIVPDANLECPSGASWVDGNISQDIVDKNTNTATSKAVFSIDDVLAEDQCLFIRVNTQHAQEENINYGQPVLAQVGYLKDPTNLSVSNIDTSTHRATVSVTNASEVTDSKVAIIYRTASQPDTDFIIAVLPYNNTYTKVIQCPDWGTDTIAFGAYAVVGDVEEKTSADGVGSYTIDEKMRSENVLWAGGSVPQAPTEVDAFPTEIAGTIRATWNWSWEEADSAILSWADHEDAWESTDEPEEFTISKIHASQWNISGLETGKTWYVRIRLVAGMEDDLTYGPWSKIVSVDLSSAPNIPTLVLSEDVITVDGTVTASWAYSSTDATAQAYAKICEVEITSEGIEYGDLIAHATTAQHVDISVVDGWQAGETHYLCLNVMSASGRESNWSDPVSITIAEPLTCEITETSLVVQSQEINPRSFEGDIVTFDTVMAEDVTKAEVSLEPIQDLHGYDKPWAGGGGANIWDEEWEVGILSWAGEPINDNSRIRTKNFVPCTEGTTYRVVTGGNLQVFYYDSNKALVSYEQSSKPSGSHIIVPSGVSYLKFYMYSTSYGATYKNDIAINYPSTVTTYEPYSNICPIDGYEDVGVSVVGVNLFDKTNALDVGAYFGTKLLSSTNHKTIYIPCKPNTTYTVINSANNRRSVGYTTVLPAVNVDVYGTATGTITTGSDAKYLVCYCYNQNVDTVTYQDVLNAIQIELGSTATDYEPYAGNDYTTDLGRTVYGGTVDLASGVLTVDRAIVDLGTLNWTYNDITYPSWPYFVTRITGRKGGWDNIMCSMYPLTSSRYDRTEDNVITGASYNYNDGIIIRDTSFGNDATTFKTAMSGVQLVYELATPQTYQLTPQQIQTLIGANNVWSDSGEIAVRIAESASEVRTLTELPMTVTVEGAGDGGTTTIAIERFENYHMDRPDETEFNGYEGETVFLKSQTGEEQMEVTLDDLIGSLDDEASYQIVTTVKDAYGQSASANLDFVVGWEHQAIMPTATVVIDDTDFIAKITVPQPTGAITGDTFDIYRLSADKPEKIIEDGVWGTTYVDPYPALGDYGYRVCFKTLYGDYITVDKQPAWADIEEGLILEDIKTIIDFDGKQLLLSRNVDVGNSWEKDFEETKYLGGSIQGDWNIAVSRSGTATTTALTLTDQDIIDDLRRLAVYAGICHIRTFDGSSFACDIQVAEDRDHESYGALAEFSFTVTKVDPEDMDGLTLAEWEA